MIKRRMRRDIPYRKEDKEFDQKVIDIARVTRVVAGGKRMRFRACVVIGNYKGKIGMGVRKGADVSTAVNKAVNMARKNLIELKIVDDTIPHAFKVKYKAAMVFVKPASRGTGIIAGGPVRAALELSGVKNVVAKMLGSGNKINNINALLIGLKNLKEPRFKVESVKKKEEEK